MTDELEARNTGAKKKQWTKRPRLFESDINPLCKFSFAFIRLFYYSVIIVIFSHLVSASSFLFLVRFDMYRALAAWLLLFAHPIFDCGGVTCKRVRLRWLGTVYGYSDDDDCCWCVPFRIKIFHCSDVRPVKTQTNFFVTFWPLQKWRFIWEASNALLHFWIGP